MHNSNYEMTVGSRAQVFHGTARKTSGGLTKKDLIQNKSGRIVSKRKHFTAKKDRRLIKHGYGTKKGHFGAVKIGKGSRKMRGGMTPLSPASVHGMENYSGNSLDVQIAAGMSGGRRRKRRGGSATNVSKPITPSNMSSLTNSINSALKVANLPKLN
jgi:hypothetical protein